MWHTGHILDASPRSHCNCKHKVRLQVRDNMSWDFEGETNNSNAMDNVSCAQRFIQGPVTLPYSHTFSTTVRVLEGVFFAFNAVVGTLLNGLVIFLVARYKKLQKYTFLVTLQVVALNLMISLLCLLSMANVVANRWWLGSHVCAAVGVFFVTTTVTRAFLMFVFVIDRFLSIFWTFSYPKYRTRVSVALSVASWLISFIIALIPVPGMLDCYSFRETSQLCVLNSGCSSSCTLFISVVLGGISLLLSILPICFYAALYCKARKMQEKMPAMKGAWKATTTFFLLFLTVFVLTLPSLFVSIAISAIYSFHPLPPAVYVLHVSASVLIYLVVVTDPIVIMRHRDVIEVLLTIREAAIKKWRRQRDS